MEYVSYYLSGKVEVEEFLNQMWRVNRPILLFQNTLPCDYTKQTRALIIIP